MNSLKAVTKYETVCSGILEWQIEDISLHIKECNHLREGTKRTLKMNAPEMQLTVGGGRHSKWHFSLESVIDMQVHGYSLQSIRFYLHFDGLFESSGSRINEPLVFKYNGAIKKSTFGTAEMMQNFDGSDFNEKGENRSITCAFVYNGQEKTDRLCGNLKISLEIAHLSDVVNEVFSIAEGQVWDSLDLNDPLPLVICYGNLLNNPDMSDFKISCEGSTFAAHKFILSARSRVFRTMIESGLSESTQNELKIEDMTVKTVELMLEFIYKGTVAIFPEDLKTRIELLDCAEKYELEELKSICMGKVFSKLPMEKDVGELAMAAFTYGANDRASKAIKNFCTMNHAKLIQDPEYKKLFLANPQAFMN